MILYDYMRSSAAYRVRLALAIKGLNYERQAISLLQGMHCQPDFKDKNPQGLVPVLEDNGLYFSQSLAICEYLDEAYPHTVALLPNTPEARAQVRAMAQLIACDIHPLNNLRVLSYLETRLHVSAEDKQAWYQHWITEGFAALECMLEAHAGAWAWGDALGLIDVCLLPQTYNAQRFAVPMDAYPQIQRLAQAYSQHAVLLQAHPEHGY